MGEMSIQHNYSYFEMMNFDEYVEQQSLRRDPITESQEQIQYENEIDNRIQILRDQRALLGIPDISAKEERELATNAYNAYLSIQKPSGFYGKEWKVIVPCFALLFIIIAVCIGNFYFQRKPL